MQQPGQAFFDERKVKKPFLSFEYKLQYICTLVLGLSNRFFPNLVTKVKSQIEQNVFIINRRKSVIRKRSSLSSTVTVSLLGNSESTTLMVRVGATFINLAQQRHSSLKFTSKYLIRSKCDLKQVPYLFFVTMATQSARLKQIFPY